MSEGRGLVVETPAPGVLQIRLDRPERLNALGAAMTDALRRAIDDAAAGDARVVVLRGTGRAFCAGADLKERAGMQPAARLAHNRAINGCVDALAALPMPTIAALNGLALGGGLELALGCDLRFAAHGATMGLTETRIGAIPGAGGTQRLPRLIGAARALHMMLGGEPVDAARAEAIGLVQAAIPADALDFHILAFARLLASRSPRAARTLKRVVRQGMERSLADGLALERAALADILVSDDYAEGLAAFAARRPPAFAD